MARTTKQVKTSYYTSTPVDNGEVTLGMLDAISRMSGASFSVEKMGEKVVVRLEKETGETQSKEQKAPYVMVNGAKKQVMEIF